MERGKGGKKRNECTTVKYKQVTHGKKKNKYKKIIENKRF